MPLRRGMLTVEQLDELKTRQPVMPDDYKASTMHVVIKSPVIRPDPAITNQMLLDRHQSDKSIKKFSSRLNVAQNQAAQENTPSTRFSEPRKIHVESERSSPHKDENQENEPNNMSQTKNLDKG